MVRVFANGPGDLGSIPGHVISKTPKMVLDASLLNTQHYKVWIKGKVEQSRERSSPFLYTSVYYLLKKEPSGHPRLWSPTFLLLSPFYNDYSQDIGMEFGIGKCAMQVMKSGKRDMMDRMDLPNQEKLEHPEKRKLINIWGYWKFIPSNKGR